MGDNEEFVHPKWGRVTGLYLYNDDKSRKVALRSMPGKLDKIVSDIQSYKWSDGDFLLMSHPKNGTHFMWEVMTMLLGNSSDYIDQPKEACMMDLFPLSETVRVFPPGKPKVLNTHFTPDILPKEFRGRKTVVVIRNPKDAAVSYYYHEKALSKKLPDAKLRETVEKFTFSDYLHKCWFIKDQPYGNYLEYYEYMWNKAKDDPNMLMIFFEDMKKNPTSVIRRVNEFMETACSEEKIEHIAEATSFAKMKQAKVETVVKAAALVALQSHTVLSEKDDSVKKAEGHNFMYRKGEIGDWKNHFTVADNEMFDEVLRKWSVGSEIPFQYE